MNRKFGTTLTPSNTNFGAECDKNAGKASVVRGSRGTFAYICELILAAEGWYSGDMDAISGDMLCNAISDYRKKNGLTAKKICDSPVWAKLFHE